jgi:arginase
MKLHLLAVPYDSALRTFRMGAGPDRLLEPGLGAQLQALGHEVRVDSIEVDSDIPPAEIRTAFELNRTLAERVRAASAAGWLPLILAGNCITAVGTLAGLSAYEPAVLWFDSHADFNTPETTTGGFLDGMALATATGRCWRQLAARVPGFRPTPEHKVVLLGTRDLDPLERDLLEQSEATVLDPEHVRRDLDPALRNLGARARDVYVHLDLDVLEPAEMQANALAAPEGLRVEEVRAVLERIGRDFQVRAVALTAYDPSCDPEGRICEAVVILLGALFATAAPPPAA